MMQSLRKFSIQMRYGKTRIHIQDWTYNHVVCVCVCVCAHAHTCIFKVHQYIFKVYQHCRSHAEIKLKVIKSTTQTRVNWVKLYVYQTLKGNDTKIWGKTANLILCEQVLSVITAPSNFLSHNLVHIKAINLTVT